MQIDSEKQMADIFVHICADAYLNLITFTSYLSLAARCNSTFLFAPP